MRFSSLRHLQPIRPKENFLYDWINGAERLESYEPGGFHPVMINDVLHNRYRIVDKLGFGPYSTIWLARDDQLNRYVAVKLNVSDPTLPTLQREAGVLRALSDSSPMTAQRDPSPPLHGRDAVPKILDEFKIDGPNGTHLCYTMAPAQGDLHEASFCCLFPIEVARALAARLAIAVSFVHSRGFVHGDIHLLNVLVGFRTNLNALSISQFKDKFGEPCVVPISRIDKKLLPPNVPAQATIPSYLGKKAPEFTVADADGLILSDFNGAFAPATEPRLGKDCQIPLPKRAPEAILEPESPFSYPFDIWSLGNAIWEIVGMKPLFSDCEPENEIVAEQIDVLGYQHFPSAWREKWERQSSGESDIDQSVPRRPTDDREIWPTLEVAFEEFVQKYRRKRAVGVFGDDETRAFLSLMRGMLKFGPEERLTIEGVLESEWMKKWALPQMSSHHNIDTTH
ncbi:protein kinase [Xylaria grammica]|nr:protein kinase [Xylaria grammica]